jgi:hypothetical protein
MYNNNYTAQRFTAENGDMPPESYIPTLPDSSNFGGMSVNPTTITNPIPENMYEHMMIQREELYRQAQEYRQKILEQNYPVKFVIGHSIVLGGVCLALVVLQIIMIINQYPLYYIGTGIWVAGFFLIPISLELILSKNRI